MTWKGILAAVMLFGASEATAHPGSSSRWILVTAPAFQEAVKPLI